MKDTLSGNPEFQASGLGFCSLIFVLLAVSNTYKQRDNWVGVEGETEKHTGRGMGAGEG